MVSGIDFKIRCSKIGEIMGGIEGITEKQLLSLSDLQNKPKRTEKQQVTLDDLIKKRDTPTPLSATAKSHCRKWLKEKLYKKRKMFRSKFTDKGLINEDEGIDMIGDYFMYGVLSKNTERKSNDYMEGECDVDIPELDLIIDNKNSWDETTFPLFETELPSKDYFWQGLGYMELWGRKHYKVVYTLTNTPMHLIKKECYWYCKDNGIDVDDKDVLAEFIEKMTFDDTPTYLKIKEFSFDYDETLPIKIKWQVEKCRNYIDELIKNIKK